MHLYVDDTILYLVASFLSHAVDDRQSKQFQALLQDLRLILTAKKITSIFSADAENSQL